MYLITGFGPWKHWQLQPSHSRPPDPHSTHDIQKFQQLKLGRNFVFSMKTNVVHGCDTANKHQYVLNASNQNINVTKSGH